MKRLAAFLAGLTIGAAAGWHWRWTRSEDEQDPTADQFRW